MKIRHGVIISLALFIALVILGYGYLPLNINANLMLKNIIAILWIASIGLIIYLIIRNVFRAIKGAITGTPQGGDYQSEAQRAYEKVTPKKAKQNNLPWEE